MTLLAMQEVPVALYRGEGAVSGNVGADNLDST